jgi:DNA-directed RNA polymerase subunit RPC12/RpoP
VIANCPTCGTHYKHEPPAVTVRARCVRCDSTLFLARLRPYRIVRVDAPSAEQVARAASHLPIGLDHPALATTIAHNIALTAPTKVPVRSHDLWEHEDPLPPIQEMTMRGAFESSVPQVPDDDILRLEAGEAFGRESDGDAPPETSSPAGGGVATFALWLATGAIAGTGASWTMGGTTMSGIAAGATIGAVTGWGWRRWTSPK